MRNVRLAARYIAGARAHADFPAAARQGRAAAAAAAAASAERQPISRRAPLSQSGTRSRSARSCVPRESSCFISAVRRARVGERLR